MGRFATVTATLEGIAVTLLETAAVADLFGIPYHRVLYLLRARKIPRPAKVSSGDLVRTPADIEHARQALDARPRRPEGVQRE
jgi:hypothetical protein